MSAVFRKEFRSGLTSMTGAIFMAIVLFTYGWFTVEINFVNKSSHFEYTIVWASLLSLLAVPVLTMRSFAEERHSKTDQLLYSLPLTATQIVLGKFFAMIAIFAIPTAVVCVYPIIAAAYGGGEVNLVTIYGMLLAYYILGCAVIALCMFLSTLTESQVIAAVLGFGVLLIECLVEALGLVQQSVLTSEIASLASILGLAIACGFIIYAVTKSYIAGGISSLVLVIVAVVVYVVKSSLYEGLIGKILSAVSIFSAIVNYPKGVFDITCIIYYLSLAALFIVFTVQSFEKRRWC